MKLRKCPKCFTYTLEERCPKCGEKTSDAHYKFIKIKDAKTTSEHFMGKK